jgi:hypothetical protein
MRSLCFKEENEIGMEIVSKKKIDSLVICDVIILGHLTKRFFHQTNSLLLSDIRHAANEPSQALLGQACGVWQRVVDTGHWASGARWMSLYSLSYGLQHGVTIFHP